MVRRALHQFELFYNKPQGSVSVADLEKSCAGVDGWAKASLDMDAKGMDAMDMDETGMETKGTDEKGMETKGTDEKGMETNDMEVDAASEPFAQAPLSSLSRARARPHLHALATAADTMACALQNKRPAPSVADQDNQRGDLIITIEDLYGELGWREIERDGWAQGLSMDNLNAKLARAELEKEKREREAEVERLAAQVTELTTADAEPHADPPMETEEEEDEYADWTPERPPHEWHEDSLCSYLMTKVTKDDDETSRPPPPKLIRIISTYRNHSWSNHRFVAEFEHPHGTIIEVDMNGTAMDKVAEYEEQCGEAIRAFEAKPQGGYAGIGRR